MFVVNLERKLKTASLENKDNLVLCLLGMSGDEERVESHESEEWLNSIDRGGLCRVSDQTYSLFYAVEDVVRKHFTQEKAHHLTDVNKHTLIKAVEENEEVLFQWCILTADTSNEDAMLLLHMITELYITIRTDSDGADK